MRADLLHVFTARFNPIRWETPQLLYERWVEHMLDSGVKLTVVECQYGERPFVCECPHVHHIGVRADSWAWTKENLINIGIARVPSAKYICWSDSDIWHRRASWAGETVEALQHYRFIQPWSDAYDLGPNDEHLNHFKSFCYQVLHGKSPVPDRQGWKHPYAEKYPHPGYCWASTRRVLEYPGGLFELGGMGSSDHAMALALIGKAVHSAPRGSNPAYVEALKTWQERLLPAVNGRIGFVHGTIEHHFHGAKKSRGYLSRWQMFLRHGFDPIADLKRNTWGVLEFAGNKPELEREWDLYLRSRNEDSNYADN